MQNLDVVMTMYNLIEYIDNYSKSWASWWEYYKNEPNATLIKILNRLNPSKK